MSSPHWIQRTHLFRADEYVCSRCGASCTKPYETCPRCGEQMGRMEYDASWVDEAEIFSILTGED